MRLELIKSNPKDLVKKVESLLGELKSLQAENESLSSKLANSQLSDVFETAEQIGDVTVVASRVEVKDNNALRQIMDEMKQKLQEVSLS